MEISGPPHESTTHEEMSEARVVGGASTSGDFPRILEHCVNQAKNTW